MHAALAPPPVLSARGDKQHSLPQPGQHLSLMLIWAGNRTRDLQNKHLKGACDTHKYTSYGRKEEWPQAHAKERLACV